MSSLDVLHETNGSNNETNGDVHHESVNDLSSEDLGEQTEDNPMIAMRKGLFGKSANYVPDSHDADEVVCANGDTSAEDSIKVETDDSTIDNRHDRSCFHENSSPCDNIGVYTEKCDDMFSEVTVEKRNDDQIDVIDSPELKNEEECAEEEQSDEVYANKIENDERVDSNGPSDVISPPDKVVSLTKERRSANISESKTDDDDNISGNSIIGAEQENESVSRRRSLRTPKVVQTITPKASPKKSTSKKKSSPKIVETDVIPEKMDVESISESRPKRARVLKKKAETPLIPSVQKTPKRSKPPVKTAESEGGKSRKKIKANTPATASEDPFNLDSNIDNHPEPLRNIQMERQSFGNIKYTKASGEPEHSTARYERTEQTATERRSNLADLLPHQKSGGHKSLSELSVSSPSVRRQLITPKKGRHSASGKGLFADVAEHTNSVRKKHSSEGHEDEGEVVDMEDQFIEEETPKQQRSQKSAKGEASTSTKKRKQTTDDSPISEKHSTRKVLPELTAEEQYAVDHRTSEHMSYSIGARVYALWNKEYYPARISESRDSSGRYEVIFVADEVARRLVATGIIPINAFSVGKKCTATSLKDGEEVIEEVEIVKLPSDEDQQDWQKAEFIVKSIENEETYRSSWEKIMLDFLQGKELQIEKVNTARDVISDNIDSTDSRRSRAARHIASSPFILSSSSKSPRTSKGQGRSAKKRKSDNSYPDESKAESQEEDSGDNEIDTFDPSAMFSGLFFVVTSAMRKNKDDEQGFSKREVRQMIESRKGTVVDDFSKIRAGEKMFLIADTHYRTHKYLSALARSVPCVSHRWIRDCVAQNILLEYTSYMLPAGVSLLTGEITPWHSGNRTLLTGKKVFIYTQYFFQDPAIPNFVQIWSPLISHMGADVVKEMPIDDLDILLTDASCTEDVLAQARSKNAIIVSSEWIIQSIIHGNLPPANAHDRFRYDYVERQE